MANNMAKNSNGSETAPLISSHQTQDSQIRPASSGNTYGTVDDTEAALPAPDTEAEYHNSGLVAKVVGALFIGVFTSNLDGSLTLATHPVISSEFQDLEDSSWLFISFWLAASCTQSIYGKLSDIYGRKPILLVSYGLFAAGCALVGIGQTMGQVLFGRVVSGFGQAGMMVLAAVVITDLVPIRDVATWQGYMNVIATGGRTLGGPLGGWLADVVGWRWSFLGQVPVFIAAIVICWVIFRNLEAKGHGNAKPTPSDSSADKLARIDFLGAITLGLGLLSLMLPLEIGGQKIPWSHPTIFALVAVGFVMIGLFVVTETKWAKEPLFPLRLLKSRDALLCYLITGCILAAQAGMTFTVPLYFQVTERSSSTAVGARLFPAVAGNAIGGILSGYLIRRTGRYKTLAIIGSLTSATSYLLLLLFWNGKTSWIESLYIFPGGLGCGIIQSAIFIAVQAAIDPEDKATGISGFFLATQIGMVLGMAAVSALMIAGVQQTLRPRLIAQGLSLTNIDKIIKRAVTDVNYLDETAPSVSRAIVASYVDGLEYSHAFSVVSSLLACCAALLLREKTLAQ